MNPIPSLAKQKACPRCGATFACHADEITKCQCNTVSLSLESEMQLCKDFSDCLCAACLEEIEKTRRNNGNCDHSDFSSE